MKSLLFLLNTDRRVSPFDITMAYDAGFDVVIPYENVTASDAKTLVEDALFSRSPKSLRNTCIFIGGRDVVKAREVLKAAKSAMFGPFKASIMIDPSGANTTAAAMVAKVEDAMQEYGLGELKGKTCAVFGTGPVGVTAAEAASKLAAGELDGERQLLLGGDSGLRGYPLRYQEGDRRWLLTLEQRFYTPWYILRLVRVGAAVFFDAGEAWYAGPRGAGTERGLLRDLGFGLRLGSTRSSGSSMLHIDLAFPLAGDASIDSVQFLVTAEDRF